MSGTIKYQLQPAMINGSKIKKSTEYNFKQQTNEILI